MKPRCESCVMDHRAADAASAVVLAELDRILAADHARLGPVELVRAGLVGDPVRIGTPEGARLEHEHLPIAPCQALGERRPTGAGADDEHVDGILAGVATHALATGYGAPVRV